MQQQRILEDESSGTGTVTSRIVCMSCDYHETVYHRCHFCQYRQYKEFDAAKELPLEGTEEVYGVDFIRHIYSCSWEIEKSWVKLFSYGNIASWFYPPIPTTHPSKKIRWEKFKECYAPIHSRNWYNRNNPIRDDIAKEENRPRGKNFPRKDETDHQKTVPQSEEKSHNDTVEITTKSKPYYVVATKNAKGRLYFLEELGHFHSEEEASDAADNYANLYNSYFMVLKTVNSRDLSKKPVPQVFTTTFDRVFFE